jgi:uncharacterized protein (TIGR02722 family)
MKHLRIGAAVVLLLAGGAALAGGCKSRTIVRDPNNPEAYDEKWGYSDLKATSEDMVRSMLTSPPIADRTDRPILVFYGFANRTSDHIDTRQLYNSISTILTQAGRVRFVDIEQRGNIAEEVGYQQSGNVSPETARRLGEQTGAEYLLTGDISSIVKREGSSRLVYYQVRMKLTDIRTSIIEWSGTKDFLRERIRASATW